MSNNHKNNEDKKYRSTNKIHILSILLIVATSSFVTSYLIGFYPTPAYSLIPNLSPKLSLSGIQYQNDNSNNQTTTTPIKHLIVLFQENVSI